MARRTKQSVLTAGTAITSIGLVAAVTAPVSRLEALPVLGQVWDATRALTWIGSGWTEVRLVPTGWEGWANLGLFIPAGYAWTRLTRRPRAVLLALVITSLVAESLQAAIGLRVAEPRDLVANIFGALLGVVVATTAHSWRQDGPRQLLLRARQPRVLVSAVVAMVVVGLGLWTADASLDRRFVDRQTSLLATVDTVYAGTRARDLATLGNVEEIEQFSARPGVRADYLGQDSPAYTWPGSASTATLVHAA